ncbi:MAG: aldo/keto reductase family protein [Planctomycetota bacterium]|nr:aldo/keto reductase family protein [Planctomycetota bacterium]MEE2896577.1 aldo/keto reductase family protein [Planctomycetota bacterium]
MKYRRLGRTGLVVSEIGFGSWLTLDDEDQSRADLLHRTAYENGINFFDTANQYGLGRTEPVVGAALSPFRRETYVLATKVFWPYEPDWPFPGANDRGLSRKHVFSEIEKSLTRLRTDHVDLYQCHRYDPDTPLEETCRAMSDLVDQGKARYWGVSEWTGAQIAEAVSLCEEAGWHRPISNQPIYNMLDRHWEDDAFPVTDRLGLGNVCFSPLAEGLLTGKYAEGTPPDARAADETQGQFIRRRFSEENLDRVRQLGRIASDLGVPMSHLALGWCLRRREISSCIIGASRPEQIVENAAGPDLEWDDAIAERVRDALA